MDKAIACVDLPAFPVQILLHDRPTWRSGPVAVLREDRPDSPILHVNDAAHAQRLRSGMRYGAALNLVPRLRAAPVPALRIAAEVRAIAQALGSFSPRVEPDPTLSGVFYIDPHGLEPLYGSLEIWAKTVAAYLHARLYRCAVVVGFGRFPTFAIARTLSGPRVVQSPAASAALARTVPLARLEVSATLRDNLAALGVFTLGELLALPAGTLKTRFGDEADRLHRLASGALQLPLQPLAHEEPPRVSFPIDPPDADRQRLLFGIKAALHELLRAVVDRCHAIAALELEFYLEDERAAPRRERIEPASPTRDALVLVDLVRLHLETLSLARPVEEIVLTAETSEPTKEQLALFAATVPDTRAANRALARIRAAFGPHAISRAELRAAHLPEARFAWQPIASVALPSIAATTSTDTARANEEPTHLPLIRRVFSPPRALSVPPRSTTPFVSTHDSPFLLLFGPYRTSGGWWTRATERDYYYAETRAHELHWIFYDRTRDRWFLHGIIE